MMRLLCRFFGHRFGPWLPNYKLMANDRWRRSGEYRLCARCGTSEVRA